MTTFDDTHMERQLSSLFRAEAQNVNLPLGTWQAILPRMGDPDAPSVLWRLRHAFHLPVRWRNPMNIKYAAPAATLLLAAIAAILFVLLSNPDADENDPVPAVSPTPELGSPTPVPTFTPLPATPTPVPTAVPTATPAPTAQPTATTPAPTATPTVEPTRPPLPTATPEPFGVSFLELPGQVLRRAETSLWITQDLVGYKEIDEDGTVLRSVNAPSGDIGLTDFAVVGDELWTDSQDLDPSIRIKIFGFDGSVTKIQHQTFHSSVEFAGESVWYTAGSRIRRFLPDRSELPELVFEADVRELFWDGTNVWVSTDNRELLRLDQDGEVLGRFSTQSVVTSLAFDGQAVWIGSSNSGTIMKISGDDGELLDEFSADSVPGNLAGLVFDGEKIWASYSNFAQTSGGVVTVSLDGELLETVISGRPVGELILGFDYVWGRALTVPQPFARMSIDRS